MKRLVSAILAVVLLLSLFCACAENASKAFDRSVLEKSELYSYDKFKKTWTMQAHWKKTYSDAEVSVHLVIFDTNMETENPFGPELIVKFYDKKNGQYDKVTAFRMMVGDKLYSFEGMEMERSEGASAIGGNVMKKMLAELQNAKGNEVAFQIDHTNKFGGGYTATIDPVDITTLGDIKAMAKALEESNFWDCVPYFTLMLSDLTYYASEE